MHLKIVVCIQYYLTCKYCITIYYLACMYCNTIYYLVCIYCNSIVFDKEKHINPIIIHKNCGLLIQQSTISRYFFPVFP